MNEKNKQKLGSQTESEPHMPQSDAVWLNPNIGINPQHPVTYARAW